MTFCKIIELPETQVLIRKSNDCEKDKPTAIIHLEYRDMYLDATISFDEEENREEYFESFDKALAEKWYNYFKNQINEAYEHTN